ncbi:MAG: fibronectin type III domain-containing protein, partial [Planctomycetota bacterium]
SIKNLKLWNNETGLRVRYNSKTDWENVSLLNRRDYGRISPVVGAELFQEVHDVSFTNLEIDGYDVAGWIENKTRQARDGITFHGRKYLNYSSFDSWHEASTPVDVSVQADSTSAQVRWSPDKWADRRRLRYRIAGKHDWQLASVAGRAATEIRLTGLVPGQTYEYQVIASWMQLVSDWTRMRTFETAA